jgi:hypothetical protein
MLESEKKMTLVVSGLKCEILNPCVGLKVKSYLKSSIFFLLVTFRD